MTLAPMVPGQTLRAEVLLDFFSESMGDEARSLTLQHVSALGSGAMGEVHRVDILRAGQAPLPAALKVALGDVVAHRTALVREAHVLRARIQDGVAQFLALVELPGGGIGLLITFESGRSLEAILAQGRLTSADTIALGHRLFSVLANLHAGGAPDDRANAELPQVVHGDIKPGNIIVPLDAQGRPDFHQARLIDFGVARLQQRLAQGASGTGDEVLGGTYGYMPVGHLTQGATLASDVFAAAVVLYECLTRHAPWSLPESEDATPIARVWALEGAMKSASPRPIPWRELRPWNHNHGWNDFFRAVLANGDPGRIPSAAEAARRIDRVRRERRFVTALGVLTLALGALATTWFRTSYCPRGLVRCNGICIDPRSDANHCGGCEAPCKPGQRCRAGACELSCPEAEQRCGESCVDLRSDRAHCGACGHACGPGQVCSQGSCAATCGTGQSLCDGSCRDIQTDRANCGACDRVCGEGRVCTLGRCVASCAAGFVACSGRCFDLATERANCGACGNECPPGQLCARGRCVTSCSTDLANCEGSCRDLQTDRAHCGVCRNACGTGETCRAGRCTRECPPGLLLCGDRCRDPAVDPANCGACGTTCVTGERCEQGRCALACGGGTSPCGEACRDLAHDPGNCGTCGNACGASERCEQGRCNLVCPPGLVSCDATCRDTGIDPRHCGACGTVCHVGERCEQGRCMLACPAASTRCGETCVVVASDNRHCGRCDRSCRDDETCRDGDCRSIRPPRPAIPTLEPPTVIAPTTPIAPSVPAPGGPTPK